MEGLAFIVDSNLFASFFATRQYGLPWPLSLNHVVVPNSLHQSTSLHQIEL